MRPLLIPPLLCLIVVGCASAPPPKLTIKFDEPQRIRGIACQTERAARDLLATMKKDRKEAQVLYEKLVETKLRDLPTCLFIGFSVVSEQELDHADVMADGVLYTTTLYRGVDVVNDTFWVLVSARASTS